MTTDTLLQNLTILLSDENFGQSSSVVAFPTQQEMIASIGSNAWLLFGQTKKVSLSGTWDFTLLGQIKKSAS